jgi:hypothetical protein
MVKVAPVAQIVAAPPIRAHCPNCGKAAAFKGENAGMMARCASCGKIYRVEDKSPPPAAVPVPQPPVAPPPPSTPSPPPLPPTARRTVPLWVIACAGVALLVGAGLLLRVWLAPSAPGPNGGGDNGGGGTDRERILPPDELEKTLLRGAKRGLLSLRPADLWKSALRRELWSRIPAAEREVYERINKEFGEAPTNDIERVSMVLRDADDALAVVRLSRPWNVELREKMMHRGEVKWEQKSKAGLKYWEASVAVGVPGRPAQPLAVFIVSDELFIAGPPFSVERLLGQIASKDLPAPGKLAAIADEALEKKPVILASGVITPDARKALPRVPGVHNHFDKLSQSSLAVWLGEDSLRVKGVISFEDEKAAEESRSTIVRFKTVGHWLVQFAPSDLPQDQRWMVEVMKLAAGLDVKRDKTDVLLRTSFDMKKVQAALPKELRLQGDPRLEGFSGAKNLQEIAGLLDRYHRVHGQYPPLVTYSKAGQPLYSWRVSLIPYLPESVRKDYEGFDPDKAWDEGRNKKLLERIPSVFTHDAVPRTGPTKGATPYLLLTGPGGAFAPRKAVTKASIKDGLGRTLMLVTSRRLAPWAAPVEDINVPSDPAKVKSEVLPMLGLHPGLPIEVALFDGTVRTLPRTISAEEFLEASRPDDGKGLPAGK